MLLARALPWRWFLFNGPVFLIYYFCMQGWYIDLFWRNRAIKTVWTTTCHNCKLYSANIRKINPFWRVWGKLIWTLQRVFSKLHSLCISSTWALIKQLLFWRTPALSQLCGSRGKHKFGEQNFGEAVPWVQRLYSCIVPKRSLKGELERYMPG